MERGDGMTEINKLKNKAAEGIFGMTMDEAQAEQYQLVKSLQDAFLLAYNKMMEETVLQLKLFGIEEGNIATYFDNSTEHSLDN